MRSGSIPAGYFPHPMWCLLHNTFPPQKKQLSCFFAQHLTPYWPLGRASGPQLSIISVLLQPWPQWAVKGGKILFPSSARLDSSPWEEGAANTVAHSKGRWVSTDRRRKPVQCREQDCSHLSSLSWLCSYLSLQQTAWKITKIFSSQQWTACSWQKEAWGVQVYTGTPWNHISLAELLHACTTEPGLSQDQEHPLVLLACPKTITHKKHPHGMQILLNKAIILLK